jgi:hypothetical protein
MNTKILAAILLLICWLFLVLFWWVIPAHAAISCPVVYRVVILISSKITQKEFTRRFLDTVPVLRPQDQVQVEIKEAEDVCEYWTQLPVDPQSIAPSYKQHYLYKTETSCQLFISWQKIHTFHVWDFECSST